MGGSDLQPRPSRRFRASRGESARGGNQTRGRHKTRGQSIVELAIVLPVVLLIVLAALDFGRAFMGWVVLNNAARVGANYAALHPQAWDTPGNAVQQSAYATLVRDARADADGTLGGCGSVAVPPPDFPSGTSIGDSAELVLSCPFVPLTPLIGSLFPGGSITVSATSIFPIRTGELVGPVVTPQPPCSAFPDFTWSVNAADPLRIDFTDATTGSPSAWIWAFGDGQGSALQNPSRTYQNPGSYAVTLDVNSCAAITHDVNVAGPTPTPSPSPSGGGPTPSPTPSPSPTPACVVPNFIRTNGRDAQGTWTTEGFQTQVIFDPPQGQHNWEILAQSLVGGQAAPCNSFITVFRNATP
jgi:hypothetical protein